MYSKTKHTKLRKNYSTITFSTFQWLLKVSYQCNDQHATVGDLALADRVRPRTSTPAQHSNINATLSHTTEALLSNVIQL